MAALLPRSYSSYARQAGKWLLIAAAAWAILMAGLIILYRFADPPFSALMAQRRLSGESVEQIFVPIDAMAPALVRTVLVSEDGRFCEHHGIDLDAIQTAIEKARDGTPRGASTISMQVAKNLFLWPSKSYLRKALEVPLTLAIELVWPKRRIMELYLNIAEWGPGVYGAEAAARHHFSKRALDLTEREAALLAVALPNPITRNAGKPGAGTRRLAALIQARAARASRYQTSCVVRQAGRPQRAWQPQVRREGTP
jgi:monofunctional biosynthetic peptidoglycan transglycosylase